MTASGGEAESGSERPVLVVLPFENLGSPDDEYFADGLTEEITARLAGLPGLGVIGRTSAIRYKDTDKSIAEIGAELSTNYVLEGSVRWQRSTEGLSRVRVTPQLVRVSDETHVWANIYEEEIADIFEVQSDIAGEVAEALDLALLDGGRSLHDKPTDNLEAYDLYLRAKDYTNRTISRENNRIALSLLERAIELDPTFAMAYSELALEHDKSYWYFFDRSPERLARAKRAIDTALELAPDLPEAHLALGDYYYRLLDYDRALEQFSIAEKTNPRYSRSLSRTAYVVRRKGQWKESIVEFERALQLDPVNTLLVFQTGISAFYLRDYEAAERYWDRALSLAPDEARPYVWTARSRVAQGDTSSAREVLEEGARLAGLRTLDPQTWWHWAVFRVLESDGERALARLDDLEMDSAFRHWARAELFGMMGQPQLEQAHYDSARVIMEARVREYPDEPRFLSELGVVYAGLGRNDEALRDAKKAVEIQPISREGLLGTHWIQNLAQIHMMLGDYDAAVAQLESLLSIPSPISVHWLRLDPIWAPLRDHPGYQALVQEDQ